MPPSLVKPLYCLTLDQEWSGEDCLEMSLSPLVERDLPFTVFVTHRSPLLERLVREHSRVHLGLHPNFLPGSTHGGSEEAVIEHCCSLVPEADCFRSHAFHENTGILRKLYSCGIRFDSNLCLYLQPGLVPLRHATGLVRIPVFWEDDIHFSREGTGWNLQDYLPVFRSPGLKVLNFHPMNISLNVPNDRFYRQRKEEFGNRWQSASQEELHRKARTGGPGTRTFLIQLLELIEIEKLELLNLRELYQRHL